MKQAAANVVALLGLAAITVGVVGLAGWWVAAIVGGAFLFIGALLASSGQAG